MQKHTVKGPYEAFFKRFIDLTASGAVVTVATGCEFLSCSAVLYETEDAYAILVYHNADLEPYRLEAMADQWNWAALD